MTSNEQGKPSATETRGLMQEVIEARQRYADYLRAVANGLRPDDPTEKEELKIRCDESLRAWRAAHESWQNALFPARNRTPPSHLH